MEQTKSTADKIGAISEDIGYMKAVIDIMDALKRAGMQEAVIAVALFAKEKGLAT